MQHKIMQQLLQLKIIDHYGYKHQLHKLIEEMRELEAVIINDTANEEHLQEEMADVLNVLEQIMMNRTWCGKIQTIKEFKIDRQIKRIEKEVQQ